MDQRKLACGVAASQKIDNGTEEIIEQCGLTRDGTDGAARADARILALAADVAAPRA
jgi:hypothetical protein